MRVQNLNNVKFHAKFDDFAAICHCNEKLARKFNSFGNGAKIRSVYILLSHHVRMVRVVLAPPARTLSITTHFSNCFHFQGQLMQLGASTVKYPKPYREILTFWTFDAARVGSKLEWIYFIILHFKLSRQNSKLLYILDMTGIRDDFMFSFMFVICLQFWFWREIQIDFVLFRYLNWWEIQVWTTLNLTLFTISEIKFLRKVKKYRKSGHSKTSLGLKHSKVSEKVWFCFKPSCWRGQKSFDSKRHFQQWARGFEVPFSQKVLFCSGSNMFYFILSAQQLIEKRSLARSKLNASDAK